METIIISLPDAQKQFVDEQVATGRYNSASDYLLDLIRTDEKCVAEEALEAKLLEGLNSPLSEMTPENWTAIRIEAQSRANARAKNR